MLYTHSISKMVCTGFVVFLAMFALTFFPSFRAHAVTAAEKAAEAEEVFNQLSAMEDTLSEKSSEYYAALQDYQNAKDACDETQGHIDELHNEIEGIQDRLGYRARDMYRKGSIPFLDLLLGAASFGEFANNWDVLNKVNESDASMSMRAKDIKEETEYQKSILDKQAAEAEDKSRIAGEAFREAEELVVQMQETYDSLSEEAQELYAQEQAAAAAAAAATAEYYSNVGYQNDDGTITDVATGQVYASASEYSAATGNTIVDRARAMLGHSYQYGASGANGAFDCSGLVGYAITGSYNRIGNTSTFMNYNRVSDPQPGDICVNEGHTGIYIGNGQMIHAADESTGVVVGNVQNDMIYVRP